MKPKYFSQPVWPLGALSIYQSTNPSTQCPRPSDPIRIHPRLTELKNNAPGRDKRAAFCRTLCVLSFAFHVPLRFTFYVLRFTFRPSTPYSLPHHQFMQTS